MPIFYNNVVIEIAHLSYPFFGRFTTHPDIIAQANGRDVASWCMQVFTELLNQVVDALDSEINLFWVNIENQLDFTRLTGLNGYQNHPTIAPLLAELYADTAVGFWTLLRDYGLLDDGVFVMIQRVQMNAVLLKVQRQI